MANASSKRIASTNETSLRNLNMGLLFVNLVSIMIRYIFSFFSSRSAWPSAFIIFLHLASLTSTLAIWRWFITIGTPKRDTKGGVKVGEDLGGKGFIEMGWDVIYMTWICTLGSAILGNWVWWFYLAVPGIAAWKLWSTIKPMLAMFFPGMFGSKQRRDPQVGGVGGAGVGARGSGARQEPGESKKQAKLRARMEKGDKRIQQVQRK